MIQAKSYAHAFITLAAEGGENGVAITEKLIAHLEATGRMKLLPQILREVKIQQKRAEAQQPHLEVAHEKDAHKALEHATQFGIKATRAHVNHSLISGWRAWNAGKLLDHSGKGALIDIYKHVIS